MTAKKIFAVTFLLMVAGALCLSIGLVLNSQNVQTAQARTSYDEAISLVGDDHDALMELQEDVSAMRETIDNDWIKCDKCGAHVHDWWYIGESNVCSKCYDKFNN